jgi:protein-S-isoprenylcysteine O-methyltransferase Ste14
MQIFAVVVAWLLTAFLAFTYFKAGSFKLTAPIATLVEAGMGWAGKISPATVRLIAALELLGAAGIVLAPIASEFLGFSWAQPIGVAAAAGLTLVMVVAMIMHGARGETKYTIKINSALLIAAGALTALLAAFGGKVL